MMMMFGLAGLLSVAAPAIAAPCFAGYYESRQMEVAGGLDLKPTGKFRYALSYGAVDEEAEGDWTSDGKTIRLTSNPMPRGPTFELLRDESAPKGQVWMTFDKSSFNWTGRVDAIATAVGMTGKGLVTASGGDGRVDSGTRTLTSIEPLVPVYAIPGGAVRLSPEQGHRLLFRFHPNDLGRAMFKGQLLTSNDSALLLDRYDTTIRFLRVRSYKAPGSRKRVR